MALWLKTLTGSLCILTILMHLLPQGKYTKYVRFYAGLLFFLIAVGPVLKLFGGDDRLADLLSLEFLKEEYFNMETAATGMAELKNEQILIAYKSEIQRQIEEILRIYNIEWIKLDLSFDQKDEYLLKEITVWRQQEELQKETAAVSEISGVYLIDPDKIRFKLENG